VPEERCPVVWLGRAAVVTLPVEIDIANADRVREDLLTTLNRGPATLIVDMAGTTFCDSAGVNALVRAFKRATANRTAMHLVVSTPGVQRVLEITGVGHLIDVYPTVAASLAATGPEQFQASRPDRGGQDAAQGDGQDTAATADPDDRAPQRG
jgi:anti-sigma B factor antagonist